MKLTVKTAKKTNPVWNKALTDIKKLNGRKIYARAGVINEPAAREHGDSGISTGELAIIQEFGDKDHIPARSFVGSTFKKNRKEYQDALSALPKAMMDGGTSHEILDLIGAKMAQDMKATIFNGVGVPPPNAPATVKRKGFNHPLLETTELLESISHDVKTK